MRKRNINTVHKKRTAIVATVLCLVSAVGLGGIYRLERLKSTEDESLVNWEETAQKDDLNQIKDLQAKKSETNESTNNTTVKEKEQPSLFNKDESSKPENNTVTQEAATTQSVENDTASTDQSQQEAAQAAVNSAVALNFTKNDKLVWPVRGNIILDFSMNSSIFFPTLNQYKYNPAIVIQSDVGTEVVAAAAGKVDSIVQSDETGLTMTIDMGNNYKAVYGQLEGVNLSSGSYVQKGQILATIASPTKYYNVEGCNLYFELLENGNPVDPLDYLE